MSLLNTLKAIKDEGFDPKQTKLTATVVGYLEVVHTQYA